MRGVAAQWLALAVLALIVVGVGIYSYQLSEQLNSVRSEVVSSHEELARVESAVANISRAIEGLSKTIASELGKVSSRLEEVSGGYEKHSREIAELRREVTSLAKELRSSVQQLRTELELLKREAARSSELAELAKRIEALENRLGSVEERLSKAATAGELSEVRESLAELSRAVREIEELMRFPATIVDATGSPVVIPSEPRRIVSLMPSATEILFAVGAEGQVVGVDSYSNYPPEVVEMRRNGTLVDIGSGWYPNVEKILSLNPDLVLGVESVVSHRTVKEILSRYGIPMILLPDRTLEDVYTSILIVGRATGHLRRAIELVAKLRSDVASLRALASQVRERPRVALIVWLTPLWITGNGTWMHDMLIMAGGVNVFSNVSGWKMVGPEALAAARPDVIVFTAGPPGRTNCSTVIKTLKQLLGDAWRSVPALINNRVYCVYGEYNDMLVRPSPRVAKAIELLIALLHPELLGLKPAEIPNDIMPSTFRLPPIQTPSVGQEIAAIPMPLARGLP